jgi:hypothetical protein
MVKWRKLAIFFGLSLTAGNLIIFGFCIYIEDKSTFLIISFVARFL